jgi:hypothetical protein
MTPANGSGSSAEPQGEHHTGVIQRPPLGPEDAEPNDSHEALPRRYADIVAAVGFLVIVFWVSTIVASDDWRLRLQAAGDALGAFATFAAIAAAFVVVRQLDLQRAEMQRTVRRVLADADERARDKRLVYLRELRLAYAEWRARIDALFVIWDEVRASIYGATVTMSRNDPSTRALEEGKRKTLMAEAEADAVRHRLELLEENHERLAWVRSLDTRQRDQVTTTMAEIAASLDAETAALKGPAVHPPRLTATRAGPNR